MQWQQIMENWNQFKGSIQVEWPKISEEEAEKVEGKRAKLVALVREKYGMTKEDAEDEVEDWRWRV